MYCLNARATADVDDGDKDASCLSAMLPPCVFCNVSRERGFDIVLEDDELVVFRDINPASAHHLQVVPKRHIDNVKSLRARDVDLVRGMRAAGTKALDSLGVPADPNLRRLGFHIPPYISVGHLHMHAHALPFKNRLRAAKYPVRTTTAKGKHKGFSWFVEVDQAIDILENGRTVKIRSC
ncbi:HIT-like protein [Exidia glandulosa HHB12029]|uniref:HIT-like protein n=1 Tax=Exidia glandulosa HHB12029 TaxID=1314781 RepID=A0A165IWN9_EXIGL|nr:HIT-like protein [Exidia glandulosa HHB12029]